MMKLNNIIFIFSLLFCAFIGDRAVADSTNIQCIVTATKAKAWAKYDVTVTMFDYMNKKEILHIALSAAKKDAASVFSQQVAFDCKQYQQLQFEAMFSPKIWSNQSHSYLSKIWDITQQVSSAKSQAKPNVTTTLQINVNFPDDFSEVPALLDD